MKSGINKTIYIVLLTGAMVFLTTCGASGSNRADITLSASSDNTLQSSGADELASSADTSSAVSEVYSPSMGSTSAVNTTVQNTENSTDYSDLLKYLNEGDYDEAIEYVNRQKYGGGNTSIGQKQHDAKDDIPIVISIIALVISILHHFTDGIRGKKRDTLDAYNTLQKEVFDELNKIRKKYPKLYDDRNMENRKEIIGYLARIERFSVGINSDIYDIETLKRCGGAYFVRMYLYLEDIIKVKRGTKRDRGGKHYDEFEKVKNKLETMYLKGEIKPFGWMETERLEFRFWEESDVEVLNEYSKKAEMGPIPGLDKAKNIDAKQRVLREFFKGKEAYVVCLKENNNIVGDIEINKIEPANNDECKIRFWIRQQFMNQKYMVEAVNRILEYTFDDCGMQKVYLVYKKDSDEVQSVIKECNFKKADNIGNRFIKKDDWLSM